MRKTRKNKAIHSIIAILSTFFVCFPNLSAQDTRDIDKLNVFLECSRCDITYIRQEVDQINYVRDPKEAHVHALVTTQYTASGGTNYKIDLIGLKAFKEMKNIISFDILPQSTNDVRRKQFVKYFQMGLVSYLSQTSMGKNIDIVLPEPERVEVENLEVKEDPWKNWVFRVGAGGSFRKESARSSLNYDMNVRASHVTPDWRIIANGFMDFNEQQIEQSDGTIKSKRVYSGVNGRVVKSMSDHWSAGIFTGIYTSTFRNVDRKIYARPAIEYNVFSYEDVMRKEFTFAYKVGPSHSQYIERTVYDRLEETLFNQSLEIALRLRQPWGSVWVGLEGSHYFHDVTKNSLEFNSNLSFRLVKGLAVNLRSNVEFIRDQLSLPAGDASLEEVLLSQKQLATNYESYLSVGFSYTFGSIYNNVVNTRL